jgi:hypothetical protein
VTDSGRALPVWLRPTRRAINWTPLALITVSLLTTSIVLGWRMIEVPGLIQQVGVAGLAAAVALGLGDPARQLLQAVPTRPIVRLTRRVALLAGATALVVAAIAVGERVVGLSPTAEPELAAALVALAAIGLTVHAALSPTTDHANEAAAGAILLWVAAAFLPIALLPDPVRIAWLHHPWIVTTAAAAVTLGATTHPSA